MAFIDEKLVGEMWGNRFDADILRKAAIGAPTLLSCGYACWMDEPIKEAAIQGAVAGVMGMVIGSFATIPILAIATHSGGSLRRKGNLLRAMHVAAYTLTAAATYAALTHLPAFTDEAARPSAHQPALTHG